MMFDFWSSIVVIADRSIDALVVIVNSNRQNFFCLILSDHILVEMFFYLLRLQRGLLKLGNSPCRRHRIINGFILFLNNLIAQFDTFIAYIHIRTGNQFFDIILVFAAERAFTFRLS